MLDAHQVDVIQASITLYTYLGLYSLSDKKPCHKISWSLEVNKFDFKNEYCLKFDRPHRSSVVKTSVKFWCDCKILNQIIPASRLFLR